MVTKTESLLVRGRLYGEDPPKDVIVCGGRVVRIVRAGRGPADWGNEEAILSPLFVDIQVNGFGGIDLLSPVLSVDDVAGISEGLRANGVAQWIPTLITAPFDALERSCQIIAEAMRDPCVRSAAPGIHLEGPHISPEDGPRGAHPKRYVRPPDLREFDRLQKAAGGRILYVTLSPEWPESPAFIRGLVRRGVLASLGHHNATAAQIARASDAGARMCTHLGNGAAPLMHRHTSPLWPQMADDRLAASFIADGHHLPPPLLKTMLRAKGPSRSILVSDCVYLAGLAPGRYALFDAEAELKSGGKVCLVGTELLAGSATPLVQGVLNAARMTDLTLREAIACATSIPARVLGLPARPTPFHVGRRAAFQVITCARNGNAATRLVEG